MAATGQVEETLGALHLKDDAVANSGSAAPQPNGSVNSENKVVVDDFTHVQAKYAEERAKRVRDEGNEQYLKLHQSDKFKHFTHDPWLPADGKVPGIQLQKDKSSHFKFVIQGAGYSGLLYGARFVEAGYKPEDIVFIDSAGGFGGTWYW